MRYVVALLIAAVIVIALTTYQRHVFAKFERMVRQSLREGKAAGDPNLAGIDPDTAELTDFGTELPRSLITEIQIADLLANFWVVWVLLVIAGCLWAARWIPASHKPS